MNVQCAVLARLINSNSVSSILVILSLSRPEFMPMSKAGMRFRKNAGSGTTT